jgi:hypothetical protein
MRGTWVPLRRLSRRLTIYLLAGLALTAGIFFTGLPSASAYNCPPNRICKHVRIDAEGLPAWKAHMRMYNSKTGKTYYEWDESHGYHLKGRTGGHAEWWWNVPPNDTTTRLDLKITSTHAEGLGTTGFPDDKFDHLLSPFKDHHYVVDGDGSLHMMS